MPKDSNHPNGYCSNRPPIPSLPAKCRVDTDRAEERDMLDWDIVWRGLLLGAVFVADAVLFVDLAKDELRDRRARRRPSDARREPVSKFHPQSL
jgi:hypothetical protein